jgi:hypothetical protein
LHRRLTISELRYIEPPNRIIAGTWGRDFANHLLDFVWRAYDLWRAEVLSKIDATKAADDLERDITEALERRIRRVMSGYEPFTVQHGPYERETRQPAPYQPPQYDIAFVLNDNERFMWPLEAKVLKTDKESAVKAYAADINEQFLTCRYAPFSGEGAMLGYLFSGNPTKAFLSIEAEVPCTLQDYPAFAVRDHKTSDHIRKVPDAKAYPPAFRCHHLILRITV